MVCHPPYLTATSVKDIVSEADLRMLAIFAATSAMTIESLADETADILLEKESEKIMLSEELIAALRVDAKESDKDKVSSALAPKLNASKALSARTIESEALSE
jgi:hypothetical protein